MSASLATQRGKYAVGTSTAVLIAVLAGLDCAFELGQSRGVDEDDVLSFGGGVEEVVRYGEGFYHCGLAGIMRAHMSGIADSG